PAPDVFLEAARRIGADPADCVVLEDAAPGAAAAHAAGMHCIAIPYVAAQADAPEFATAGLLLRAGQRGFAAGAAAEWVEWRGGAGGPGSGRPGRRGTGGATEPTRRAAGGRGPDGSRRTGTSIENFCPNCDCLAAYIRTPWC